MDALRFFRLRHDGFHAQVVRTLLESGLSDEQLRARPHPAVNSIAWLLWHMSRCEDMGVNRLVVDGEQILHGGDWRRRLGVPLQHHGTGMTEEEVDAFSAAVDIAALRDYWLAVGRRTHELVNAMSPDELEVVPDPAYLRRVLIDEGVLTEVAQGWVPDLAAGRPKGWFLGHLAMTHHYSHWDQAMLVRGMLTGVRGR